MKHILLKGINAGIKATTSFSEQSRLRGMNIGIMIGLLVLVVFIMLSLPSPVFLLFLSALFVDLASIFWLNFLGRTKTAQALLIISVAAWVILATIGFGKQMNMGNYLYVMLVATLIFDARNIWRVLTALLMLTSLVVVKLIESHLKPFFPPPAHADFCSYLNVFLPGVIITVLCWSMVEDANFFQEYIIRSRKKLSDSNLLKDKLLSVIGHDLRSPLASLRGILSIGLENLSKEEYDEVIRSLQDQLEITEQTVNGLLEWSYQNYFNSNSAFSDKVSAIDITEVCNSIFAFYQVRALAKKIALVNHIPSGILVHINKDQLAFVFRNIIGNAIKYCLSDGTATIEVSAQVASRNVAISIKDNGVGIPADRVEHLFELKKKKSTEGTLSEKGAGLGLIFCKEFVENNNGNITVASEWGKGAAFTITLPLASSHTIFSHHH